MTKGKDTKRKTSKLKPLISISICTAMLFSFCIFTACFSDAQTNTKAEIIKYPASENNPAVIRLSDGYLTFERLNESYIDTSSNAMALVNLKNKIGNIPLLYVQAPGKINKDIDQMPDGIEDYSNAEADNMLKVLNKNGVETLDLRETFAKQEDYHSYFFITDHHWNQLGAFLGYQQIFNKLTSEYNFRMEVRSANPFFFNTVTHKNFFLGSQGKAIGSLDYGVDDFPVMNPEFATKLTVDVEQWNVHHEGGLEDAIYSPAILTENNLFETNTYAYYGGGDYPLCVINNSKNPDGPTVLLLRESYSCAMTPFLAVGCKKLVTMDMRYYDGSAIDYINQLKPDIVISMATCSSTTCDELFEYDK